MGEGDFERYNAWGRANGVLRQRCTFTFFRFYLMGFYFHQKKKRSKEYRLSTSHPKKSSSLFDICRSRRERAEKRESKINTYPNIGKQFFTALSFLFQLPSFIVLVLAASVWATFTNFYVSRHMYARSTWEQLFFFFFVIQWRLIGVQKKGNTYIRARELSDGKKKNALSFCSSPFFFFFSFLFEDRDSFKYCLNLMSSTHL